MTLPSLDQVNGPTTIKGARSMSCDALNSLQSDDVFLGGSTCSTKCSSTSPSAGAKGGIAVGIIVGILLLMLLWYWLQQRQQRQCRQTWTHSSPTQAVAATAAPALVTAEKLSSLKYQQVPANGARLSVQSAPRKPVRSTAAMIDGRSIHEAPIGTTPVQEFHELEGGPIFSNHQRPIHSET